MSEKAINYVKDYLISEKNFTELTETTCESNDDFISYGRKELAEMLLQRIIGYQKAEQEINKDR